MAKISDKERRWVEKMQRLGLFPRPKEPKVEPPPPEGHWRITSAPNGQCLIEINNVPVSLKAAMEIFKLARIEKITLDPALVPLIAEAMKDG
jgi:hypothetical protein